MDRKIKSNSQAHFNLSVADFEAIMNKESLCGLPSLVNLMDENLAININDFINNPIMSELQLNQAKLIETIKLSSKFHYDNKTSLIKFKEKADRNIIIIGNFTTVDDRSEKEEFLKKIISDCNSNYMNKIKKIDFVGDSIHVVFHHEDISMDVEKYLTNLLQDKEASNDEFSHLRRAKIFLAAESLKRRVLANLIDNSLLKQIQSVNKAIGSFVQRRYTAADKSHINLKRDSDIVDRKENLKTFNKKSTYQGNGYQHMGNFNQANYRDSVMSEVNDSHLSNRMSNNFSNKHQRNSKVLHNKFDFVQEQYFAQNQMNYNSNMHLNSRKVSLRGNPAPEIKIPLNKEYEVDIEQRTETESAIKLSYTNKEIISVYYHMNFLKKFDLPHELKENFMSGVMLENAKNALESFRAKKLSTVVPRDRSRTLYNIGNKRYSSVSKLSFNERPRFSSIHHDIVNMLEFQRKRQLSVKAI